MNEIESKIRILAKMFPEDLALGSEVRKLANELKGSDFTQRKKEWDTLKTTKGFLECEERRKQNK